MPLYRQVTNFTSKPAYPFAHLIKQLQETGTSLEVLFISADATNKAAKSGLKINEEIKILQDVFSSCLKLRINFTHAIGEECIDRLRDGSTDQIYHIIHFAGHAVHDREVGERSYISIGDGLRIEARQLATWIKDKGIWLFYLNACTGAAIGHKHQLAGSESLGLMDAILSAGVPYTVGFRWPIPPTSSIKLAQCFYKNLLAAPYRPEIAMLRARNFAFGENADDPVWAASMLVAQPSQLTFDNGAV
jgi:CHAT domain-containing protein